MKSYRDAAKASQEKKLKMYGAKSDEVSSHFNRDNKYGCGGPIKKADGGSVSGEMDDLDGEPARMRGDRASKKPASTTVNIIVGKGPDAPGAPMAGPPPPAPMPPPAMMPPGPGGPPMPMRASGGRVHLTGGADSGIGRLEKNHKK